VAARAVFARNEPKSGDGRAHTPVAAALIGRRSRIVSLRLTAGCPLAAGEPPPRVFRERSWARGLGHSDAFPSPPQTGESFVAGK
jgi:hypothetical protein